MPRSVARGLGWTLAAGSGLLLASVAYASPTPYTSQAAFLAALTGSSQTQTFESVAVGTMIPSGSAVGSITFSYVIPGFTLEVRNDFGTTSGTHYLGVNSLDGTFVNGDSFTMGFGSPVTALGLYVVTPRDQLDFADDFELRATGSGTVQSSGTVDRSAPDPKGYNAYFLGLIDPAGFSQARFVSDTGCVPSTGCQIVLNVDDITTSRAAPVPEPATLLLLGSGLGSVVAGGVIRQRRRV